MINIQNSVSKFLIHPLLWRLIGFGSSIVGFSCYARSPSFRYLFGQRSPLKIVVYSVVSSVLSILMLFVKRCSGKHGRRLLLKAQVGFVVLALTSLWAFLEDRREQGKAENGYGKMMNLTSTGAFSLMAMSLSRQLQLGFDVGVTSFLVGCFLMTVMKMSLKLAPLAAFFCYLLVNIRSISDFLLERARGASQRADDTVEENLLHHRTNSVTDEPDFQDLEANSDVFASDTDEANFQDRDVFVHEIDEATDVFAHDTVADREILSKKESGEPEGADSFRSGEILVCILKKYGNEIRSILSPKNIGKSKQLRALRKYGNGVRNFFPTKKFKDDTNEAKIQDLEANSNVFAHDANEANFQDLEENSNVLAPDIDEASFQDLEASSDVFAHDTNEAKIQDLEAISDVFAHDANEANFQDLEANFDDFAHDANETNFEDLEANSNVIAPDTSEASFQDLEANSDVFAHDTVADRENFIKRDSGESKVADSLKSREIPIHVLKKYGNDIQNILSPKNIGKSKEVRALRKYGNGVRNFFSPKRL